MQVRQAVFLLLASCLAVLRVDAATFTGNAGTTGSHANWSAPGTWLSGGSAVNVYPGQPQTIANCANNGSGLIRITLTSAPTPAWVTGDKALISGVVGTTEANEFYTVTLVDSTHLDLQGSSFTNAYTSGGAAVRNDIVVLKANYIDVDVSVGIGAAASNNSPYAIECDNPGLLTLDSGVTLTVRGIFATFAATGFQMNPGSSLVFDDALASFPYQWRHYSVDGETIAISGTSTQRCSVSTTTANPANAAYYNPNGCQASVGITNCDFSNFGGLSSSIATSTQTFSIVNCTFNHCGAITLAGNFSPTATLLLQNNIHSNSATAYAASLRFNALTSGGGSRTINQCSFDAGLDFPAGLYDCAIQNCYLNSGFSDEAQAVGHWKAFSGNFYHQPNLNNCMLVAGDIINNYYFSDNATMTDPNVVQVHSNSRGTNNLIGNIFEANANNNNGAWLYSQTGCAPTSSVVVNISSNLCLPSANPATPGASSMLWTLVSGTTNLVVNIEHNTACVTAGNSGMGMVLVGDMSTDTSSGQVARLRSNLAWSSLSSQPSRFLRNKSASLINDCVVPANCGYNAGWNLVASSAPAHTTKPGYISDSVYLFSTTPLADTTDVSLDATGGPNFVDSTRCLAKAYTALFGQATTGSVVGDRTGTLGLLQNDPSKIATLLSWVKAGYAPQNTLLQGAAHDAGTIGAFPFASTNGSGPSVTSFTASPTAIQQGSSATLSWSTLNTTNVVISPGIGTAAASDTTSVSPTNTTTYTLIAYGSNMAVTNTCIVAVYGISITAASATPTHGVMPLAVQFTVAASELDGTPITYQWSFGDGGASTNQNPIYTYTNAGVFTATVVANSTGPVGLMSATSSVQVAVATDLNTLTVNLAGSGTGTVTLNPSGGVYVTGTVVTLTAISGTLSAFTGWSGDVVDTNNPTTILMNTNHAVTATFKVLLAPLGTPLWWLAQYGWTNNFTAVELALDPDGVSVWKDYLTGTNPTNPLSGPPYNIVPYAEGFENLTGWGGVYTNVAGAMGWSSGSGDQSLITNVSYTYTATNLPLPGLAHTNVLQLNTQFAILTNSFGSGFDMSSAPLYLDMMVQFVPSAQPPQNFTVADTGGKCGVYVTTNNQLAVYHGVAASDGTLLSNTVDATSVTVASNLWHRLTVAVDATATNQANALAMFQVRLDGVLVTNANTYADGWNAQFSATGILPSTIATGTWFRLATTNAVAKKFTALCLAGNGYADDIVVTTINPFFTSSGTCLLIVTTTGNGISSLGSGPYISASVALGVNTQIVYMAGEWCRIATLTSNTTPVSAAGGVRVFTQVLNNVSANISNAVAFALATPAQSGYTNVPTSWLTNWTEAAVQAALGRDGFGVYNKYLLGLDPTSSNSYQLLFDSLSTSGSNVVIVVRRAVTGTLSPGGMHGNLIVQGSPTLAGGGFTNIPGTTTTGSAVFDGSGRRAYTNALDGNVKFYKAIVQ